MKVSGPPSTASASTAKRASAQPSARQPSKSEPVESVSFRGVPESELTPRVRKALVSLIEEVTTLRKELDETRARMNDLEVLAHLDPLLNVPNRRAFVRDVSRALAIVERYGGPASLVFADVDNLKTINDSLGHSAGDAALAHVAAVIAANIRQSDSLGRIGGDEFGIVLLQANQETASEKARTLAEAVAESPVEWNGNAFNAHISYGVVEFRKGWDVDVALESADTAMYEAKRGIRS